MLLVVPLSFNVILLYVYLRLRTAWFMWKKGDKFEFRVKDRWSVRVRVMIRVRVMVSFIARVSCRAVWGR